MISPMRSLLPLLLLLAPLVASQEPGGRLPITVKDSSNERQMGRLMNAKLESRQRCRENGICGKKWNKVTNRAKCINGFAGEYPCKGIDLLSQVTHPELGSFSGGEFSSTTGAGEGADVWGWEKNGREFGIVTQTDGTAFVEILPSGEQKYLGRLPTATVGSLWRDAKVVGDYVYISAESTNHGIQIFNLNRLLPTGLSAKPVIFTADAIFRNTLLGSAHNVVAPPPGVTNYIMVVGQKGCKGSPYMIDISNPLKPKDLGCNLLDGYSHDAQIVKYNGPDAAWRGKTIATSFNEDTLTIYDLTNLRNLTVISKTTYPTYAYTHQGWWTDDNHEYLVMDDELDEMQSTLPAPTGNTATYLWKLTTLTSPQLVGTYRSPSFSIDHNQYVINGLSYQANYCSGLRVVDVSNVRTGGVASMKEVAFFDVRPEDNDVEFLGSWSSYVFKSGHIIVNSIERGSFVVQRSV